MIDIDQAKREMSQLTAGLDRDDAAQVTETYVDRLAVAAFMDLARQYISQGDPAVSLRAAIKAAELLKPLGYELVLVSNDHRLSAVAYFTALVHTGTSQPQGVSFIVHALPKAAP